jgi:hypothetical protein
MRGIRLVLVLVLAAVMDLGSPVLPEAHESLEEEIEEAAHGRRRPSRVLALARAPRSTVQVAAPAAPPRPAVVRRVPAHAAPRPERKIPPPLLDSASAPDDH